MQANHTLYMHMVTGCHGPSEPLSSAGPIPLIQNHGEPLQAKWAKRKTNAAAEVKLEQGEPSIYRNYNRDLKKVNEIGFKIPKPSNLNPALHPKLSIARLGPHLCVQESWECHRSRSQKYLCSKGSRIWFQRAGTWKMGWARRSKQNA